MMNLHYLNSITYLLESFDQPQRHGSKIQVPALTAPRIPFTYLSWPTDSTPSKQCFNKLHRPFMIIFQLRVDLHDYLSDQTHYGPSFIEELDQAVSQQSVDAIRKILAFFCMFTRESLVMGSYPFLIGFALFFSKEILLVLNFLEFLCKEEDFPGSTSSERLHMHNWNPTFLFQMVTKASALIYYAGESQGKNSIILNTYCQTAGYPEKPSWSFSVQ